MTRQIVGTNFSSGNIDETNVVLFSRVFFYQTDFEFLFVRYFYLCVTLNFWYSHKPKLIVSVDFHRMYAYKFGLENKINYIKSTKN